MLQDYNRFRLLQEFFDAPLTKHRLRALSRQTGIAPPSVTNHLKALEKAGLITKKHDDLYPVYQANRDEEHFKTLRKADILIRLQAVTNHLYDTLLPDVILLFGSASRGEDTEESDIDLLVICKEKPIDLERYEQALRRKINVFFCEEFMKLSPELRNNLLNGIVLKGYLDVFRDDRDENHQSR